jgi:hypothetical protein
VKVVDTSCAAFDFEPRKPLQQG